MKILIVSQYFWPENFRINDICRGLREKGHEIVVLTGKPNYPRGRFYPGYSFFSKKTEYWENIKIYRSMLISRGSAKGIRLILNYFSFAFFASMKIFVIKESFDKIFVYEPSPITVGIPAIIAKLRFKAPIYFWVQDLWPESITAAGGIQNKIIIRLIDFLTKAIYAQSKFVLIQSRAFKNYILKQNVDEYKIIYYPNSTEEFYRVETKKDNYQKILPNGFKLMFAGNIGRAQSFDTLLNAARLLKDEGVCIKWIILGDGRMRNYVKSKIAELALEDVFFLLGTYPPNEMPFFFSCADALLVSLQKDNVFSLTIPSKVQSYMACGKPIIGALNGEGARLILEANAGFASESENHIFLVASIKKMVSLSQQEREFMGQNARIYFENEFERNFLLTKLEQIFCKE